MRLLVLGGTVFLGRHLVDAALARGHAVTIFHRGRHAAHRPGDVEEVLGDRARDLGRLAGRRFDAVIDTSGYLPGDVAAAARVLDAAHYTFVSSASVYADLATVPVTEDAPLLESPDPGETDAAERYGELKAACERALAAARPDGVLVQRPGLIAGPHDLTDRVTYWAERLRRRGRILAPAVPEQAVHFIDARDMAAWSVEAAEAGLTGVMNVNAPRGGLTFGELLATARGEVAWVDEQRLIDAGVEPWSELPLWLPARFGLAGMMDMDTSRAQAAGLTTRPVAETLADTAAWAQATGERAVADYGTRARSLVLSPEREAELLAALAPAG